MPDIHRRSDSKFIKGLTLLLGTLLAAGLFWWLWQQVDPSAWQSMRQSVPTWAWLFAGFLWAFSFHLRAQRIQQEWRWKRRVPWHEAMRVVLLHNAAVLLLPLRAGELGYPLLVRQVYAADWREALRSLMWLRLQDVVVLGGLALLLWPGLPVFCRLLLIPALVLLFLPARTWRGMLTSRSRWVSALRPWLHRRGNAAGWLLSLANWVIKISVVAGILLAMTSSVLALKQQQALAAALGGELAALIPVQGPAGLGTYEVGVWFASGLPAGAAPLIGLAALQVHGFCIAVSLGLAGLWGLWGLHSATRSERHPS